MEELVPKRLFIGHCMEVSIFGVGSLGSAVLPSMAMLRAVSGVLRDTSNHSVRAFVYDTELISGG